MKDKHITNFSNNIGIKLENISLSFNDLMPSEHTSTEHVREYLAKKSATDVFNTVLYSKTGSRHEAEGKGCEDNIDVYRTASGIKAVALSDGAGSCSNAALGSKCTSSAAAQFLATEFDLLYSLPNSAAADKILKHIQRSLAVEGRNKGIEDFMSLSATVIAAAMSPDGRYILYHVGDGAIIGYSKKNGSVPVSRYEHSGPVNLTSFVTERHPPYNYLKGKNDYSAFLLMSDGPEHFMIKDGKVSFTARFLQEISYTASQIELCSAIENLVTSLRNGGMNDDCSFALINDCSKIHEMYLTALPETIKIAFGSYEASIKSASHKNMFASLLKHMSRYPEGIDRKTFLSLYGIHNPKKARVIFNRYKDCGLLVETQGGIKLINPQFNEYLSENERNYKSINLTFNDDFSNIS